MIDYGKLNNAIETYMSLGYEYIELPWSVEPVYSQLTKPDFCEDIPYGDEMLVGSGEQSFIQMFDRGKLSPGKYVGVTPCFRDETVFDQWHKKYFMKVELIVLTRDDDSDTHDSMLNNVLGDARTFFNKHIYNEVILTDQGYDLYSYFGIELGSYGVRSWKDFHWVYGTGCAEPRLTSAIALDRANKLKLHDEMRNL